MGTNYFWESSLFTTECHECGSVIPLRFHIGKSSAGWEFGFQAHSDVGKSYWLPGNGRISSWRDWKVLLSFSGTISDEYGRTITFEDFQKVVEERSHPKGLLKPAEAEMSRDRANRNWLDSEGYSFSDYEFS